MRAVAAALLGAGAAGWGVMFVAFVALDVKGIPEEYRRRPQPLAPADLAAMTFVRQRVRAGELVYRNVPASTGYAEWGGLPQPFVHWRAIAFGISPDRISARRAVLQRPPADIEPYLREGFAWLVLDPSDTTLRKNADAWITAGRAKLEATFGRLQVIALR
jgi:hypothetical protein